MGYGWRLRRGKAAIPKKHKPQRLAYAEWILKQPQTELNRMAYVDGTTFFLARTADGFEDKQRAALGKYCYRLKTGEDSLEDQNVGPSCYASDDPCEFHLCSESYDTCMSDMLASDVLEDVGFCGMSDTADMNWKEINVYLFSTKQCQTCKMCHKKQCLRTFAMSDV